MNALKSLPIDEIIPEIIESLKINSTLILKATPGAGKTTRVPPALLKVCNQQILVLEPRRLAARLSAERVAFEMNEPCGQTVGYQIRYSNVSGEKTRIKFITEGLFLRLLLSNPTLSNVDCVVLDEFHERHIHSDVTFALVRHLQKTSRPDLKLVIMSATLETGLLSAALPEASVFESFGRAFNVDIEYLNRDEKKSADQLILQNVTELLKDPRCPGHILVFLAGQFEIKKAAGILHDHATKMGVKVFELRADLSVAEQELVFKNDGIRKIILSTNVAETSVTIDGVTGVIDTGTAKVAGHAAWSGLPTLSLKNISQANLIQRAGRAGRTSAGVARRLFTLYDYGTRTAFEKPEIQRLDLTQILLELSCVSAALPQQMQFNFMNLPWLEAPAQSIVDSSSKVLQYLGAFDEDLKITPLGKSISKYPMHPRLARVLEEGRKQLLEPQAALAVALLNEGMIFKRNFIAPDYAHSDVAYQIKIMQRIWNREPIAQAMVQALDSGQLSRVELLSQNLLSSNTSSIKKLNFEIDENKISQLLFVGFPDRVAQVRQLPKGVSQKNDIEVQFCQGGNAQLSPGSVVRDSEFFLALEAEETRLGQSTGTTTQIRVASALEKDDILYSFHNDFLKEIESVYFDETALRVRSVRKQCYGTLTIEEGPIAAKQEQIESTLCEALKNYWPKPFEDGQALDFYKERCSLLQKSGVTLIFPDIAGEDFELFLMQICENKKSFAEIAQQELGDYISEFLSHELNQALQRHLPEKITIGAGRKVVVHYDAQKPPWIASRLQDFFGTKHTPRIAQEKIALVVHLLAPNGQAMQVTQDLDSFWDNHYPAVRRELCRRYPRHSWPEDPRNAPPPEIRSGRKAKWE